MVIAMWMINLFSLFSCFGAVIVLLFISLREKDSKYWKLLLIISIYVFSYATGILHFILNYGFTIPEIRDADLIPSQPSFSYYFSTGLYLFQMWLIIEVTCAFFEIPRKLSYWVFIPFSFLAYFVPDVLLVVNREFLMANTNLFIVIRTLLVASLMEHAMIVGIVRRKIWYSPRWRWLLIMISFFSFFLIPAMFVEEVLMLYSIIPALNIFEASGFFLLMATTMIGGIFYLSSEKRKGISLLDLSEQYGLTAREMDVLKELLNSANISYKEIAANLSISPETVKTHVSRIYKKLGVSAKQELKYKIGTIKPE